MKKGLLLVIEGIDGSGKSTQANLLAQDLLRKNISFEVINFPRYEDNLYGKLIRRYLTGEFGPAKEVNPYLLALAYAEDRALAKPLIEKWLSEEKIVIANRYASSSKAYLGANVSQDKREELLNWLDELEYRTNGIPEEDLTILLTVDPKIGQKNVAGKHTDIHEENLKHLEQANKIYLELAKKEANWYVVDCIKEGNMRTPQDIHQELLSIVKTKL